jgi:hydrogenase/urease accessory protein HupE
MDAMVAMASIAALYARGMERHGWLMFVTSLVSFIGLGMMLVYALAALPGLSFPIAQELIYLGVLLATVGLVVLGFVVMAVKSEQALPRWCGAAIIAGSPPFAFLGPLWGGVLLGVAWALVGYALFRAGARLS